MIENNSVKVNLSNSQLRKLKLGTKHSSEKVLRLSSKMIGYFNDKMNFPHKL